MACACDPSCCCWPTRTHQQHQCICMMGQSENLLGSHLNNLCRPMRHSRAAAAHIALDRPIHANWEKPLAYEWAHVSACARDPLGCYRPTRAHWPGQCICIVGQCKHPAQQPSGQLQIMQANRYDTFEEEMGQCEAVGSNT